MIKASLDQLAEIEDIEIIWRSFELRPLDGTSMPPDQEQAYRERIAAAWPRTRRVAEENFGVDMEYHRWGVQSRLALEGAKYAEEKGHGDAYHTKMFEAHFVEDRDFGDPNVLADLAEEIGLDRADFVAAIENRTYAPAVDADVRQARMYGIQGVPAVLIKDKYMVSGAQPLPALQDIVKQVRDREGE